MYFFIYFKVYIQVWGDDKTWYFYQQQDITKQVCPQAPSMENLYYFSKQANIFIQYTPKNILQQFKPIITHKQPKHIIQIHIHQNMGTVLSKLRITNPPSSPFSQLNLHQTSSLMQNKQASAYRIWLSSSKTIQDMMAYLDSDEEDLNKVEVVEVFVSSITNREKLYHYGDRLEGYLLGENKLGEQGRAVLLGRIHAKLSNIFMVWSQLGSPSHPHITSAHLHERMLPQLETHANNPQKLVMLYFGCSGIPALDIGNIGIGMNVGQGQAYVDIDMVIKQAIRVNYPYLVNQETLRYLFQAIIEKEVVIDDVGYFCRFINCVLEILGSRDKLRIYQEYSQKLHAIISQQEQKSILHEHLKHQSEPTAITHQLITSSKIFLQIGYPHAIQLIFQCIINHSHKLHPSYHKLYLYTKIYSMFVYNFEEINLEYGHLQKMSVNNVIHLMLRNNDIKVLVKLKDVYEEMGKIGVGERKNVEGGFREEQYNYSEQFQNQLVQYIFSNYCNLQICLQISTNPNLLTITKKYPKRQYKLLQKLNQSKFEVIIQNQTIIKNIVQNNLSDNQIFVKIVDRIQQILEIVRLFYMFGVNQKFGNVSIFYCPQAETNFIHNPNIHIELIQQQRALLLFKSFISKYYISSTSTKTKKITLNPKSQSPLNIDLAKPEAIFQISQYLYTKLFSASLKSIKDIHQIIFQHMIYFYRYEEAKSIMGSQSVINRYQINTEMLQIIIINNIIQIIQKSTQTKKIINDINQQLKLVKNQNNVQVQSIKAMVRLITQLNQYGVELTIQQKNKMDMAILYGIVERYADRIDVINFDTAYEEIRAINADYVIDPDQKFMMTNQLLKFKCGLAAKAYQVGKKNLGNELIDQINQFNPPWLTTKLIQIFKNSHIKIDKRIYGIAMKSCSKGQDLQYLMQLWKEQQGKQRRKQKGFADLTDYFQTGRQYLVIDNSFIESQEKYRNYVAECQFNDQILHLKKYQLFFVLLGSETQRAFHYALKVQLDPAKVQTFLRQAMKTNIINIYNCLQYLHKYFYFVWRTQQQKLSTNQIPIYMDYLKLSISIEELHSQFQKIKKQKNKSAISQYYIRIINSYLCSTYITQKFIYTYFSLPESSQSNKNNLIYQLIIDDKSRKNMLIQLREQPMGRSDIFILNKVCTQVLDVNLLDLCIFNLCNIVNTSQNINDRCENIMQKIITLTTENQGQCRNVVGKFVEKIFSVNKLVEVLRFMRSRENQIYRVYVKERNIQVIQALAMVEINQQLHGIIPNNFFQHEISLNPKWPISQNHYKTIKKSWTKTNIFVISKVMYFIYGMNPQVQTKIWQDYLRQHPDDELRQIKIKLDQFKNSYG